MKAIKFLFALVTLFISKLKGADDNMWEGHGTASGNQVEELIKALQAQEGVTDIANLVGGGALQPQSLESTLAMLTFQDKHLVFYKDIGKVKAFSTLEEYSVQDGYGPEGGFVDQMQNPEEDDPDFQRKYDVVKYIRTLWKTADVLTHTNTISSPEVKNKQAAMMRALRITERNLFFGNADIISQSFNGLEYAIDNNGSTDHIIDMRGADLTEIKLKQAAELISVNYGVATDMYVSPGTQTKLDSLLYAGQRLNQEAVSGGGLVALGHKTTEMRTSFGNFSFKPDIFMAPETDGVPTKKDSSNNVIEGATSTKSPAMPTVTIDAQTSVTNSQWTTAGDDGVNIAGEWYYRVAAINQYGKSKASVAASGTVAADGSLTLAITDGAGAYTTLGYEIYRETAIGSGIYRKIATVAKTGSPQDYVDLNAIFAGTSKSFLVDNTTLGEDRTMALKQLAPIHSVQYAKIAPYNWGTINYYVTPTFYAPLRCVKFVNVGVGTTTRNPILDL